MQGRNIEAGIGRTALWPRKAHLAWVVKPQILTLIPDVHDGPRPWLQPSHVRRIKPFQEASSAKARTSSSPSSSGASPGATRCSSISPPPRAYGRAASARCFVLAQPLPRTKTISTTSDECRQIINHKTAQVICAPNPISSRATGFATGSASPRHGLRSQPQIRTMARLTRKANSGM